MLVSRTAAVKLSALAAIALLCLSQTGCVVGRRTMPLPMPDSGAPVTNADGGKGLFYVGPVADNRHFEDEPKDPSTPSIDGTVGSLSAEQKAMMIGRQRNGYGHAMGDVALPSGASVNQITHDLVEQTLRRRGYGVTSDAAAPNKAAVSIDQFWSWLTPGFVEVTFEARVYCTLRIRYNGRTTEVEVHGYGRNPGQVARDGNWQKAYSLAFEDFEKNLDDALAKNGL